MTKIPMALKIDLVNQDHYNSKEEIFGLVII